MNKTEIALHIKSTKSLIGVPSFKPLKKKTLKGGLSRMGGSRLSSSGYIEVSSEYLVVFIIKDGEVLTDTSFFAYLFQLKGTDLYPIIEYHWHPSHKLQHIKIPCGVNIDYTNRLLPGAKELDCSRGIGMPDPRTNAGIMQLIESFCRVAGIAIVSNVGNTEDLWANQ